MHRSLWTSLTLLLLTGCAGQHAVNGLDRKAAAESFMRGVYGGDPSVVDELAAENVVISYPIFQKLFNSPTIRGHDAVEGFVRHFAENWADPKITIDQAIAEGDTVVLVWSFRARNVGTVRPGQEPSGQEESWGGITVYRFDAAGKITVEVGEESAPGPEARLAGGATNGGPAGRR